MNARAQKPLLAWYGDDFTGSAAVLEILQFAGIPAILFTDIPGPALLERFSDVQAIGIAGTARAQSPDWMERELPAVLSMLTKTGAELVHYKVCSTLDSSPEIGSIGKAIDIASGLVGGSWHPFLVAAPQIGRFQAWGNLFAAAGDDVYRLDRHPTMSRHPVTPMHEADIRRHLAAQTDTKIGVLALDELRNSNGARAALEQLLAEGAEIVAIDAVDQTDMELAGRLIWEDRTNARFAIGSQGIEYGLVAHWQSTGMLATDARPPVANRERVIAAVSGSVSPVTATQIEWAGAHGFALIEFRAAAAVSETELEREIARVTDLASASIRTDISPLIHSANGPDDPRVETFRHEVARTGMDIAEANARVGVALGDVLANLLENTNVRRIAVSGGDTSGFAVRRLGVKALSALSAISPGTGIAKAHLEDESRQFEIALKGGQMGTPDYFGKVRDGGVAAQHGRTAA